MKQTACKHCKFFLNTSLSFNGSRWYNHFCKASPRPLEFDYFSGKMVTPNPEFRFCRDVNKGDCPLFVAREASYE